MDLAALFSFIVNSTFLQIVGAVFIFVFLVESLWSIFEYAGSMLMPFFHPNAVQELTQRFGPWAVVTGCTDGIGKEYSKELARRGLNVVLISRNLDKLNNVASDIEKVFPVKTKVIVADFSKTGDEHYRHIADELKDIPVGILVNNVGCNYDYPMPVCEVSTEKVMELINVNVGAVTLLTRLILPGMLSRGRGAIVNVSSGSENQPLPFMTIYAATKAYIKSFTAALREEYSSSGIVVQHLSPFFVSTKMNAFSDQLLQGNLLVPDARRFAQHAVSTLGRITVTCGYWAHGIQCTFTKIPPVWFRTKCGAALNRYFRESYLKEHENKN